MGLENETEDNRNFKSEDETIENEDVDSSDDLKNEKQKINEFHVKGNSAYVQLFIQNNMDSIFRDILLHLKSPTNETEGKSYNLKDKVECAEFIERYKNSEYLIVAIILSTFEVVLLGDLPDLREQLMEYLPETKKENEPKYQKNPYISIYTILNVISGKYFNAENGDSYIGFGDGTDEILINVLNQFPALRKSIILWLIQLHKVYKYVTGFEFYQIVTAFTRVISIDMKYAKIQIFPLLCDDDKNINLLGNVVYKLYSNITLRERTEDLIVQWLKSGSMWIWKSIFIAYILLEEGGIFVSFKGLLGKTIRKKFYSFTSNDLMFLANLLIQSKNARTYICHIFNAMYNKSEEMHLQIAQMYIQLVKFNYFCVNSSFIELPLVACDNKEQQEYLEPIVRKIITVYSLRKQIYIILEVYLRELSEYSYTKYTINHISAYLYNMAFTGQIYRQDLMYFLSKCKDKAARQVYTRLLQVYDGNGGKANEKV